MSVKVGADLAGFSGNVRLDREQADGAFDFVQDVVQLPWIPVMVNDFRQPAPHLEKLSTLPEVSFIGGRFRLRLRNQMVGHDALDVLVAILAETAGGIVGRVGGGAVAPVDESGQRPRLDRFVQ